MKFRWKWVLGVAGAALLVTTWFLASWAFERKDDARRAAAARLGTIQTATARVLHELLVEADAALAGPT